MNAEERNVMTIVTIGRIIESSLFYCLPPKTKFLKEERDGRFKALTALSAEGSPLYVNCEKAGEGGRQLMEDLTYFIEDVYGENGRIVYTDLNNDVHVEVSLIGELYSTIVKLRNGIESLLNSAMKVLKDINLLESDFETLIKTDIKYYHALAGKVGCTLISDKFKELNKSANEYGKAYSKSHGGINPNTDPEFNVKNDPSIRMLENEFHELNMDLVGALNSYNDDSDFNFARENVYADCDIFTGKKKPLDLDAFYNNFTSYFDKIINFNQNTLNVMFTNIGMKVSQSIKEEKEKNQAENANENNTPEQGE